MKILMIAPEPFFEPRGTPISVYQRLEALSALGHQVDLITYHVGKDVEFPNVRILRTPAFKAIQHVRVGASRAKLFLDVFVILKATGRLLTHRYDVIHSHEEAAFFSMPLAALFRKKHIYDMHSILSKQLNNYHFGNRRFFYKLFESLERKVLRTCDAVITVGTELEAYVRSVNPNMKQMLIENIALHAYQTPVTAESIEELKKELSLNGKLPVIYTGTYERYQGLEMVLESIDIVRKDFPNVIFIFVGAKNRQAREWTQIARNKGLGDHTLFLDVVSPEESMVYLAYATVLISPRVDGMTIPLKIYSYLHSGKPIVATNIVAHTQVLNSETALIVEPNKESFAEGIIKLLKDPKYAERLGANAHEYALANLSYQIYLSKVNQIYTMLAPVGSEAVRIFSEE